MLREAAGLLGGPAEVGVKVLLDNCFPLKASVGLAETFELTHALDAGWDRLLNGALLQRAAEAGFDAVLTIDKQMLHEHNHRTLLLPLVIAGGVDTRVPALLGLSASITEALEAMRGWMLLVVDGNGRLDRRMPR